MHTHTAKRFVNLTFALLFLVNLFFGAIPPAVAEPSPTGAAVITALPDYPAGSLVTLNGSGWVAGEAVHIFVNDDVGQTWSLNSNPDPVANDLGNLTYQFTLPVTFIATYYVTATGPISGVATTTFTDAPAAVNLDQCRNGSATSPNDCKNFGGNTGWVNGNVGASQAHMLEGYSTPFRAVMTNLPTGTAITLVIGYDIRNSGANAYDYLTSYQRLEPHNYFGHPAETVFPTDGVAGLSATTSTFPIPAPSSAGSPVAGQPTASFNSLPAAERVMTLFGGSISNVQYIVPQGSLTANQSETQVAITFTVDNPTAVLAWGGHISQCSVWGTTNGVCNSAGGISGSPYHMRLVSWGPSLPNLGNTDRSMAAAVVVQPGNLTLAKALTGGPADYTGPFTINYNCGTGYTGSVSVAAGSSQTINGIPSGSVCTISETPPTAPAGYTFGTPTFSPSTTVTIGAGTTVTVTTNNTLTRDQGYLKITKVFDPKASGFTGTFAIIYNCGASDQTVNLLAGASTTVGPFATGTSCTVTEPTLPVVPGWTFGIPVITGSPATIVKGDSTTPVEVIVTNSITQNLGSLKVTKVVDWNHVAEVSSQSFQICITGPSYAEANCKTVGSSGGDLTWDNLLPGEYTVSETDPGSEWTVTGLPITVTVPLTGAEVTATITNTRVSHPSISIDKKTNGADGLYIPFGADVTWTYLVTNTGNVALTNVSVTDDQLGAITCPQTTLAVAGSMTCTATGNAVAGQYNNLGTATGTPPVGGNVTATDPSSYFGSDPSINIVKTTNDADGAYIPVGTLITWKYVVTNTGNVVLTNVTVTDNILAAAAIDCGGGSNIIASLAVGASATCAASGTAVAGAYNNIGTATGTPPVGDNVSDTDDSSYFGSAPAISIVKTTNGSDGLFIPAGAPITWIYVVTNTGNVALTNVTVTDNKLAETAIDCGVGSNIIASLAAGASVDCTAAGMAVAGQYNNTGAVVGTPPVGDNVSDTDDSSYFGSQPSIIIDKNTNGADGLFIPAGTPVIWTYMVTNTGNVTLDPVSVIDSVIGPISCPKTALAVDESMTCTANGTAIIGEYKNTGTVTGKPPVGDDVTASDDSSYFGSSPAITIDKTTNGADNLFIPVSDPITWTYVVKNTGNVTLNPVNVSDSVIGPITCPESKLAVGDSMTCTATGTAMAGPYSNIGTATGTPPVGDNVTASDPSSYFGSSPAIDIVKTTNGSDGAFIPVGAAITWNYHVTNTGNVALTNVTVTDNKLADTAIDCGSGSNVIASLATGASVDCTAAGTAVAGLYENTGTATGTPPVGGNVNDTDDSSYFGSQPSIDIVKTTNGADGLYILVGDPITWSYLVTNTGNVDLTNIVVTDDKVGAITCAQTTLAVGASMTCTATGIAVTGQYDNTGTVVGTPPVGDNVTASDPSNYFGSEPGISIVKTTNDTDGAFIPVGAPITWKYVVTNTGNVTLTNVTVTDNMLDATAIKCSNTNSNIVAILAPQAFAICTATGTAEPGLYENTGTATGKPPVGEDVSDTDESSYFGSQPSIDIVKTTNGADNLFIPAGDPITWTYVVKNTGNVALTSVTVTDDKLADTAIDCGGGSNIIASLAVGASATCTATGTAVAGSYSNIGTATGTPPVGDNVSDTDDSSYFGSVPAISIVKTTNDADGAFIPVGTAITWKYVVTNTGNVVLTNVTVTDNKLADTAIDCGSGSNVIASLATGASVDCTAAGTAVAGLYENTGTATGTPPVGDNVSHTDDSSYFGSAPKISIMKSTVDGTATGDGIIVLAGETITWRYTVINTGNVPLSNVTLTDSVTGVTPAYVSGDTNNDGKLDPTETWIFEATGKAIIGAYSNTGTATGTPPVGSNVNASDDSSYFGANPKIAIDKVTNGSDGLTIITGMPVTWTYSVTNIGNEPISNVTVSDSVAGVTPVYVSGDTNNDAILDLTETWIYQATGSAIVGSYSNTGTASGSFTDDASHTRTATATDPSSYTGKVQVKVNKTVNKQPFSGPDLTFQLRQGAAPINGQFGTILETQVASVTNNGQVTFDTLLSVGTYQLCEFVPEGYVPSYIWGTYGIDWFKPGYAPGQGGLDPNILVCVNFTVKTDGDIDFQNGQQLVPPLGKINIDNQVGQMPRTIGYWKNHAASKESGGGQAPVLDQMLCKATTGGNTITIGLLALPGCTPSADNAGTSSTYAVRLLNKSTIDTNKKMASDPLFNLVAQLVAYRLNAPFGAWPNTTAASAADYAQQMLVQLQFNGKAAHLKPSAKAVANLNYLAAILDAYNNDTLAITTLSLPYPGVYK